ncbi:MAG TPA: hypothetical protein VEU77_11875 [Candidatus Acidoferrales bacterium]|nr:hypothetical protein [Candidatus Acidoferrales bacterium]
MGDAAFLRRAGTAAYGVALFSIAYAVVYLGFASRDPTNVVAVQLAWALIAAGALSASIATAGLASYIGGAAGIWLTAFGVGYSLLAVTHGTYAAIAAAQGFADLDLSPTDPRGLATFGLAGLWLVMAGLELRGRTGLRLAYPRLAIVAGVDLILLYVATVVGYTPAILVTGGLASVVLGPTFWAMTGRLLRG